MIRVTRLNGKLLRLNAELIESVEAVPDTVITLIRGKTIMVKETVEMVIRRIMRYQHMIHSPGSLRKKPHPAPQIPLSKSEGKT
ncbi:MAG: flagellar FlbD family protein [Candidatus Ozemobacteraceae bacterium]